MPTCAWDGCSREATHGLAWSATAQRWQIDARNYTTSPRRWCKWHATVQAVQRNARGVTPRDVATGPVGYRPDQ